MPRRQGDILVSLALGLMALAAVAFLPGGTARLLLVAPLVLFLPGHALLRAFAFRASSAFTWFVVATGLSMAVTIVGGFVLNGGGWIDAPGWVFWCAGIVIVADVATLLRGHAAARSWRLPPGPSLGQGIALAAAVLLIVAAFVFTGRDSTSYRPFPSIEFWMVAPDPQRPNAVTIGVTNGEATARTFDIEVTLAGRPEAQWRSLYIGPGETVTKEVAFSALGRERAEAWLVPSDDRSKVHRRVFRWVSGRD